MTETRKVEFAGANGDLLAARLDLPADPRAFALFAHCFTCGKDIFAAGMHVAAMMPCGHIAVYVENGTTKISMLHPKYMTVLYPNGNLDRAVQTVTPLFEVMLDEVSR